MILPPAYRAYAALIDAARPRASLARLGLGVVLTVFSTVVLMQIALGLAQTITQDDAALMQEIDSGATPRGVLWILLLIGMLWPALALTARLLHDQSVTSLTGPFLEALPQFLEGLKALALIHGAVIVTGVIAGAEWQGGLSLGTWALLLPLTAGVLLVQIGGEELAFRGYLQAHLAALGLPVWVFLLGPSALFGLLHYDPAVYGDFAWTMVGLTALFGLAAADLTARAGTLGPAFALHFANNFSAIAVMGTQGALPGLALVVMPDPFATGDTLGLLALQDLGLTLVGWLALRLHLRR